MTPNISQCRHASSSITVMQKEIHKSSHASQPALIMLLAIHAGMPGLVWRAGTVCYSSLSPLVANVVHCLAHIQVLAYLIMTHLNNGTILSNTTDTTTSPSGDNTNDSTNTNNDTDSDTDNSNSTRRRR
jgi:hypothetical protein